MRLSDESIQKIIDLYKSDTPVQQISKEVDVNLWSVYYQIRVFKSKRYYIPRRVTYKKIKSEHRVCNCEIQDCKGRFIVRSDSKHTVCPFESIRRGIVGSLSEYYK